MIWIRPVLLPFHLSFPKLSLLFSLSSLTQIPVLSSKTSHSLVFLNIYLLSSPFGVQCLCHALRDSQNWDTTTAPCRRRTLVPPVWNGLSFQTMSCSTRAAAWVTTTTAGTRIASPTRGVSSDRTQEQLAGPTATATRVYPQTLWTVHAWLKTSWPLNDFIPHLVLYASPPPSRFKGFHTKKKGKILFYVKGNICKTTATIQNPKKFGV